MDRTNHYEAAFEAYLQQQRLCYVAVDESRRTHLDDGPIKSLDFIVQGEGGLGLLVDIKGRRFPGGPNGERRVWECWSTRNDVDGLDCWAERFGPGYLGIFVFAYQLLPSVSLPEDTEDLWTWRDRRYLFRGVAVADYRRHMRVRSPRWGTVGLPREFFREVVRPLRHFTHGPAFAASEEPFEI